MEQVAAKMQQDEVFASAAAKAAADERLRRLNVRHGVSRIGLLLHLKVEEEFALMNPSIASAASTGEQEEAETQSIGSSSESESSSSDSDSDEEPCHAILAAKNEEHSVRAPSSQCDTMRAFRHSRTKMLHYGHNVHSDKTGCGRLLSEAYYVFPTSTEFAYPKCKHCFGHFD